MTTSFEQISPYLGPRGARLRSVIDSALVYVRDNQRSDGSWAIILGHRGGNADARADLLASYVAARDALPARLAATPLDAPARDALWALVAGADQWLAHSERY
jgi:hypothetical protein